MAGMAVLRALRTFSGRFPGPVESVLSPASCVLYPAWRTSPVRTLQLSSALCAGHNKWSKVKHIKGPKDVARAKMFMKFSMMIKVAVRGELKQLHGFLINHTFVSQLDCIWISFAVNCRRWIQSRLKCRLSPDSGAVQKQEYAKSLHRGCNQECGELTTYWHKSSQLLQYTLTSCESVS